MKTSLHDAATNGNTEAIKLLVELGADVNAKDNDGNTPLHFAARNGHAEAVKVLIELGADVKAGQPPAGKEKKCSHSYMRRQDAAT